MSDFISLDDSCTHIARLKSPQVQRPPLDLWDRIQLLPLELEDMIIAFAGILSEFQLGRLPRPLTKAQAQLIAANCLDIDATTKLHVLPSRMPLSWEVVFASSRRMRKALRTGADITLGAAATEFLATHSTGTDTGTSAASTGLSAKRSIEHIADCMWLDLAGPQAAAAPLVPAIRAALDIVRGVISAEGGVCAAMTQAAQCAAVAKLSSVAAMVGHVEALRDLHLRITGDMLWLLRDSVALALRFEREAVWQHLVHTGDDSLLDIRVIVGSGCLAACHAVHARFPEKTYFVSRLCVQRSIQNGGSAVTWWLLGILDHGHDAFASLQDVSVAFCQWDLLQYCERNRIGKPISARAMNLAAQYGNLDAIVWLYEHGYEHCWTPGALVSAATYGHLHVVEWLIAHQTNTNKAAALDRAATFGHVAIVKVLVANMCQETCNEDALIKSALNGHIEIVQLLWLTFPDVRPSIHKIIAAAKQGHLQTIEFILEHIGTDMEPGTVQSFADMMQRSGHTGAAEYLRHRFQ